MDSFYESGPRKAPIPTTFTAKPTLLVPEVSLINTQPPPSNSNNYIPYNNWKQLPNKANNNVGKSGNIFTNQSIVNNSLMKKVRFESPPPDIGGQVLRSSENIRQNDTCAQQQRTFDQIYLANVPKRPSDLSCITSNKNSLVFDSKSPAKKTLSTDNQFLTDSMVTDILNYKSNSPVVPTRKQKTTDSCQTSRMTDMRLSNKMTDKMSNMTDAQMSNMTDKMSNMTDSQMSNRMTDEMSNMTDSQMSNRMTDKMSNMTDSQMSNRMTDKMSNIMTDSEMSKRMTDQRQQTSKQLTFDSYRRLSNDNHYNVDRSSTMKENVNPEIVFDSRPMTVKKTAESSCQTSGDAISLTAEPSVKDLLQIIAQQNEQLLQLQRQVATLLDNNNCRQQQNKIESPLGNKNVKNTANNYCFDNNVGKSKKAGPAKKFAIDLMTSFQVSVRPNPPPAPPKIQEIVEEVEENDNDNNEREELGASLAFGQPLKVMEQCPSPEPSIQIDMNEYESSDEDCEKGEGEGDDLEGMSHIGETFYRNLMGQVNKILKKAQVQTCRDLSAGGHFETCNNGATKKNNKTMLKVRDATLKHLKNIGVSLPPINDDDSNISSGNSALDDSSDVNASEVSFLVKQILMKYLPPEHLAHAYAAHYNKTEVKEGATGQKGGLIPYRPEFSFATVQYMKKYNLLAGAPPTTEKNVQSPTQPRLHRNATSPKILDISKLKNQPKLL